jgi:hypothetical protein
MLAFSLEKKENSLRPTYDIDKLASKILANQGALFSTAIFYA